MRMTLGFACSCGMTRARAGGPGRRRVARASPFNLLLAANDGIAGVGDFQRLAIVQLPLRVTDLDCRTPAQSQLVGGRPWSADTVSESAAAIHKVSAPR